MTDDDPIFLPRRRVAPAEMDITPMIDITFLLLIFFLVCSSPDAQAAVDLAPARYGDGVARDGSYSITLAAPELGRGTTAVVYLAASRDEEKRLPDEPAAQEEAVRRAVEAAQAAGATRLVIRADRNLKFREVNRIVAAAAREGMTLHLAVLEID